MSTTRRQRWAALTGATLLVGAGLGVAPLASTPGVAAEVEQRTTSTTADGMVVEDIRLGDTTVTTYGYTGADVTWNPDGPLGDTEASAEVTFPTGGTPSGGAARTSARTATTSADSAPTVYEMSIAAGMSPAEACEFVQGLDSRGCRTGRQVAAAKARAAASGRAPTTSAAASSIHDSWCADFKTTKGDGSKHNHACVVRYRDAGNTSYVWLANKMKATGWVRDPGAAYDRLKGVGMQLRYVNERSKAVDWDPYATSTVGDCRSFDTTVEGKSGTSYSQSTTVCPDKISPHASDDFQWFGSRWTSGGQAPADETRGTVATSLQQIPKNSAGGSRATIYQWLSWS